MTANAQIKLKNTVIDYESLKKLGLNLNEYCLADLIHKSASDPNNSVSGWGFITSTKLTYMAKALCMSRATAYRALQKLKAKRIIEFHPENKTLIRATNNWFSLTMGQLSQNETDFSKEKIALRENNINILSPSEKGGSAKKPPSCPLLNGSPLKEKYPNGHTECLEYIQGIETARGRKFINLKKQYQVLHNTLKAGYGFSELDKAIRSAERKYGEWNFDLTTLAAFLEKGINARP